jgi:hypothetical protein
MNPPLNACVPSSVPSSVRSSASWKLRGCRLHTIRLLSLTLQLFAHQEWEGNSWAGDDHSGSPGV